MLSWEIAKGNKRELQLVSGEEYSQSELEQIFKNKTQAKKTLNWNTHPKQTPHPVSSFMCFEMQCSSATKSQMLLFKMSGLWSMDLKYFIRFC